jgi:putative heme iron utilization protein
MSDHNTQSLAEIGRQMIADADMAALASLDRKSGGPSASLIALATLSDNTPIFLISSLAEHTKNLIEDPRAGLLIDETRTLDDPLTGPRLTLIGRAAPIPPTDAQTLAAARARYLTSHPSAEQYVDFADFAFYQFSIERAHYVGGFGKISAIAAQDLKIG